MPHSSLASPSATRAVLAAHGLQPKKSLSQHFLIDDNIVGKILELARIQPGDAVLEVGPGIGTLTVALCPVAGHVVALERDRALLPALEEATASCANLTIVMGDALAVSPDQLVTPLGPPVALVANLPYSVAATVVLRCFESIPSLSSATVMVQSEVADRMAASPGGKEYGAYTVKLRLRARPAGRFQVARGCFVPPPRVDSSVLRLERVADGVSSALAQAASLVATAAFSQRRKTLRNSLLGSARWPKSLVDEALELAGIDGGRRAEMLSVEEYVRLARELQPGGTRGD